MLGPLEVVGPAVRLDLGGLRPRALLALLLLNANGVVSVERLIEELWGEEPPASVAKRCRSTSRGCGRLLGPTGSRHGRPAT